MTLILALDCADGLLLASDSQATVSTGGQPVKMETEKLHRPWSNIGWGASGMAAVAQLVEQALAKYHSHANTFEKKTVVDTCDQLSKTVTKVIRDATEGQYMEIPKEIPPFRLPVRG
jgi:20S proteasome alpha/beta subunit